MDIHSAHDVMLAGLLALRGACNDDEADDGAQGLPDMVEERGDGQADERGRDLHGDGGQGRQDVVEEHRDGGQGLPDVVDENGDDEADEGGQRLPGQIAFMDALGGVGGQVLRRAPDQGLFAGALRRGAAHTAYMRMAKRARHEASRAHEQLIVSKSLADAWNAERLRCGDMVGGASSEQVGSHPNAYSLAAVLRNAWLQVGKIRLLRVGLDGFTRSLNMLTCVSSALHCEQKDYVDARLQEVISDRGCPVVFKFYDCSPVRMGFGMLQDVLMPYARYPIFLENKWRSVPLQEYMKERPRANLLRYGVLELLAQGVLCSWTKPDRTMETFRVLCRPRILQAASASCLMTGTETEVPQFSTVGLTKLCEKVPAAILCESPDAAKSNGRKKAATAAALPRNCFHVAGVCDAHQAHRIIEMKLKGMVGDVHAISVAASNPDMQNKLQLALRSIIDRELVYIRGEQDEACVRRNARIAKHTLLRRRACIASCPDEPSVIERREDGDELLIETFLAFWNGDWRSPTVTHICQGCCSGPEQAKEHMFASASGVDLCQSRDVAIPSLDDWGTAGVACGASVCGMLCHDILRRIFGEALPDWNSMQPAREQGDDSEEIARIRLKVQKKAWRSRQVLANPERRSKILLVCWLGAPIERLISYTQFLDDAGHGMFDVVVDTELNPFYTCRQRLCKLVNEGADGELGPVFDAFPVEEHPALMTDVAALGLDFAAQVHHLKM